jgi:hypothetical protein
VVPAPAKAIAATKRQVVRFMARTPVKIWFLDNNLRIVLLVERERIAEISIFVNGII